MSAQKTEFLLIAGEPVSQGLIDALDTHNAVELVRMVRSPALDGAGWRNSGVMLRADRSSTAALEADAGRQALGALRQLFRLGLGQPACDGHVCSDAADPKSQEQLAARLEQLQLVVQALGDAVSQQSAVLKKMQCAHGVSSGETPIVAQQDSITPSDDLDPLYGQAVDLVRAPDGKASISYVQRKLRISYNRAAQILESLEKAGIVSPADHMGLRKVAA